MPVPIVHLNYNPGKIKQVKYNQNSIIEGDSTTSYNEAIEHTNDIEFWSQSILPDGSCQRIYRDGSQYIKKPDEYEFKKVEDISKVEYQNLKTLTEMLNNKIHNRLKELGKE